MKPLEIERPWIKKKLGLKITSMVIVVFITTFTLLSVFNFYDGKTVNIQQIDVSFSNPQINSYSYAYGKDTYRGGSTVTFEIDIHSSKSITFSVTGIKSCSSDFTAKLENNSTTVIQSGLSKIIPVEITFQNKNYVGELNIRVITS
jgi:hypothetical protein